MEPRLRASPEQFSALIDFMERHGDLSRPKPGLQGRLRGDLLWQEIADILNATQGGVEKSLDKWKKVWVDWKTKTKKKYLTLQHARGSGGGPSRLNITAVEDRVLRTMGMTSVFGQVGMEELGLNRISQPIKREQMDSPTPQSGLNDANMIFVKEALSIQSAHNHSPSPTIVPEMLPWRSPTPSSPAPSPITLPAQSRRATTANTRHFPLGRTRRIRFQSPLDRAVNAFVAIEKRRLRLEEIRERRHHEREIERLRLESQRVASAQRQNDLLEQLSVIAQALIGTLAQQGRERQPSTDTLSDV